MKQYSNLFFLIIVLILTAFMIINPQETVTASASGFKLWYSVLLPALLPFFIVAELLISLGFVGFLGVLLEPVMRPVFKLPGCSALVIVMGFTSGFPMGAILSKKLYDDNILTGEETERLVSFTNNSSPLFIIGSIGVGMFSSPALGYLLAVSHYLANILVGIMWRFRAVESFKYVPSNANNISQAYHALLNFKRVGLGHLLRDAIKNSLNNILAIAGFIIIFSVLTRMLTVWGIMDIFAAILVKLFAWVNLTYPTAYGTCMGFFEITIGAKAITVPPGEIIQKLITVSLILAFSGLSIIAQVMSVVAGTPVRLSFYLVSRLVQMIISGVITYLGYILFLARSQPIESFALPYYKVLYSFDAWNVSLICLLCCIGFIALLMILSLFMHNQ